MDEYLIEQMEAGFYLIPSHMHGAIKRYILYGIPPGSFLTALLCNDFMNTVGNADDNNRRALLGWAQFLYSYVPSTSYGSPEKVQAYMDSKLELTNANNL